MAVRVKGMVRRGDVRLLIGSFIIDYLYTAYLYALRMLGITGECSPSFPGQGADNQACAQYNMILTNRWGFACSQPRSHLFYR